MMCGQTLFRPKHRIAPGLNFVFSVFNPWFSRPGLPELARPTRNFKYPPARSLKPKQYYPEQSRHIGCGLADDEPQ
ncbi:hypothetical protein A1507_21280 [Methylomonas koyamae]|uniref:Uncharacterized protein n=1 Tax=Methylomonas koyamae TaxID=702114 RepID=A0A177MZW9_9GAMM|nr:hypothetical protein AYM39_03390 [Methylomonas sp. DH-1]ATG88993.1 hypothetical protein MKLM6_0719 [Methylomonas koyamae]OAI10833.1 hypothetical protein A1507_21280 [Methylomonas koyamae]